MATRDIVAVTRTIGTTSGGFFRQHPSSFTRSGRLGVVDHVADASMVYLDVDRRSAPSARSLYACCRIVGVSPLWLCYRRSTHGWHIIMAIRDQLEPAEIVALQACCGSDPRREALNLMRVLSIRRKGIGGFWSTRWNLLYAYKLQPQSRSHRTQSPDRQRQRR